MIQLDKHSGISVKQDCLSQKDFQQADQLSQTVDYKKSLMVIEKEGKYAVTKSIRRRSWTKQLDPKNNIDHILLPLFYEHFSQHNISVSDTLRENCFLETSLTKYNQQDVGFLDWHQDILDTQEIPRVYTMSLFLNDDFRGGVLELKSNHDVLQFDQYSKNTCVIFPSSLEHRVTQVTEGCRRVVVCWLHCPQPDLILP